MGWRKEQRKVKVLASRSGQFFLNKIRIRLMKNYVDLEKKGSRSDSKKLALNPNKPVIKIRILNNEKEDNHCRLGKKKVLDVQRKILLSWQLLNNNFQNHRQWQNKNVTKERKVHLAHANRIFYVFPFLHVTEKAAKYDRTTQTILTINPQKWKSSLPYNGTCCSPEPVSKKPYVHIVKFSGFP
jgi:hypothetical protein